MMNTRSNIHYLKRQEIDPVQWDQCIDRAHGGLIYAYSDYLDHMSAHWDALVFNDYEAVMPLTWNRKYRIHYLYQPFFCAQLGIFGNQVTAALTESFLRSIPQKFRYWDIYLNAGNLFEIPGFSMYPRANYVLSLEAPYPELYHRYAQSHKRNIRRALDSGNRVGEPPSFSEVISLASTQARKYSPISQNDYRNFQNLLEILKKRKSAASTGVYDKHGALMASAVWVFSHQRAYYILVGNHPDGRTSGASHLLIDHFIQSHAESSLLLDFEGGSRPSLAFFYRSFGSTLQEYPGIKLNRLPLIVRHLK